MPWAGSACSHYEQQPTAESVTWAQLIHICAPLSALRAMPSLPSLRESIWLFKSCPCQVKHCLCKQPQIRHLYKFLCINFLAPPLISPSSLTSSMQSSPSALPGFCSSVPLASFEFSDSISFSPNWSLALSVSHLALFYFPFFCLILIWLLFVSIDLLL